ncbi:type II secretion system protein F [Cryobacterium sp. MLB-32]|uniref:type II secretion system F family protein n=1 Tax=Cryobacterium sp. MLB-32 TaxID=1529318 RepID=UPI0004E7819F|nr:type II secretion system F family protein [Cryobacterium sp. MLB-32]KFF58561.1 type II secretion system protein F [Cryobacterium sp. MLB-32]
MTLVLGCLLGAGLLLLASPILWPAGTKARSRGSTVLAGLRGQLAQAGLASVPAGVFVAVVVLGSLAMAGLAQGIFAVSALTVVAGIVGAALPGLVVSWRVRGRRRASRTVWPDVVDHLVSALRSGLALPDSVSSLAASGPVPTRRAFARFEREYRATGNFTYCLDELKRGLADPIADRILETLRMAREVGGSDVTLVLRNLAAWLRQDAAIRSEVEARQSWVVNAARLGVAAPWIVLALLASRPEAAFAYNTPAGIGVIIGGLIVSVIAYRVMIALGRLPAERRWFV